LSLTVSVEPNNHSRKKKGPMLPRPLLEISEVSTIKVDCLLIF
jgi:hypothetical protein